MPVFVGIVPLTSTKGVITLGHNFFMIMHFIDFVTLTQAVNYHLIRSCKQFFFSLNFLFSSGVIRPSLIFCYSLRYNSAFAAFSPSVNGYE